MKEDIGGLAAAAAANSNGNNSNNTSDARRKARTLFVVVVEQHQHALEHIHQILRRSKVVGRQWNMLHFDAHPDLAAPQHIPAMASYLPRQVHLWNTPTIHEKSPSAADHGQPNASECDAKGARSSIMKEDSSASKDLYDLLDTTASGISEWILPLVLSSGLRTIQWVKPSFSNQLPMGVHQYNVGVQDENLHERIKAGMEEEATIFDLSPQARIMVDWRHPYYMEDGSCLPISDTGDNNDNDRSGGGLLFPKLLELQVAQIATPNGTSAAKPCEIKRNATSDPWVLDVCLDYFACCNPFLVDIMDAPLYKVLDDIIQAANFMKHRHSTTQNHFSDRASFSAILKELLQRLSATPSDDREMHSSLQRLLTFYDGDDDKDDDNENGRSGRIAAQASIRSLIQKAPYKSKHIQAAIDAIPFWHMPHAPWSTQNIDQELLSVQQYLKESTATVTDLPLMVTIARSTDDGFTPKAVVEKLQSRVVEILRDTFETEAHSNYGGMAGAQHHPVKLKVIHDYGDNEGSCIDDDDEHGE